MRVFTLPSQQASVIADALVRRGWNPVRAEAAASGLKDVAFLLEGLSPVLRENIANAARQNGIECLTGDGWVLIAGTVSRVAGLARPGFSSLPDDLAEPFGKLLRHQIEPATPWRTARGYLPLDRPRVVGILNVTPDSFSDGGRYLEPGAALAHAACMVEAGADIIDIGGESTKPGTDHEVSIEEEWRRLQPVIERLCAQFPKMLISVDTVKSVIAKRALEAGAAIINDVSAFRIDPHMAAVCANGNAGVILMHSRGGVRDMASYDHADYTDLMTEVCDELQTQCEVALSAGVASDAIVVDPGLGFGKRPGDNFTILRQLRVVESLGYPVLVGPSRKRFLRSLVSDESARSDEVTAAACVSAYCHGAVMFRVHDVTGTRAALAVAHAVRGTQ